MEKISACFGLSSVKGILKLLGFQSMSKSHAGKLQASKAGSIIAGSSTWKSLSLCLASWLLTGPK